MISLAFEKTEDNFIIPYDDWKKHWNSREVICNWGKALDKFQEIIGDYSIVITKGYFDEEKNSAILSYTKSNIFYTDEYQERPVSKKRKINEFEYISFF
jgi:uncharacterized protein YutD